MHDCKCRNVYVHTHNTWVNVPLPFWLKERFVFGNDYKSTAPELKQTRACISGSIQPVCLSVVATSVVISACRGIRPIC